MRRSLAAVLLLCGCSSTLEVEVALVFSSTPDPFVEVTTVRLRALVGGRLETIGEDRWDQGPLDFPTAVSPDVDRFIVEGLGDDGRVLSSGATAPLNLLTAPPDGPLEIFFSRVGVLSELEDTGVVRRGGRAVALNDGTTLFLGGVGEDGCPLDFTEVYSNEPPHVLRGPPLVGGRVGDLSVHPLADGRILVVGGSTAPGCGERVRSDDVVILDGQAARPVNVPGSGDEGAAVAALGATEVIVAGGEGPIAARADVSRFNVETSMVRPIGALDGPRAFAAAVAIAGARVVLLGGRAQRDAATALDSATVFVPSRGAALDERIPLGLSLIAPAVIATRAGGVLFAGGRDARGKGHAAVRMLVVKTERDFPVGDTTAVTSISSTVAAGTFIDAGDGSLLFVDGERSSVHWIQLLPRRSRTLDADNAIILGGGVIADGRVVLRSEDGRFFSFNPGVSASAGIAARDGRLAVTEDDELEGRGVGIVPLRPDAWNLTTRGLTATRPLSLEGDVRPEERGIFVGADVLDFDVAFDMRLESASRAAFLFGVARDREDHLVLGGQTSLHRGESMLDCSPVQTPELTDNGVHRIRIRREGEDVSVEIDGRPTLSCALSGPQSGQMGFGLVGGTATFDNLDVRRGRAF